MDRSWIHKSRVSAEYIDGVKHFIQYAIDHNATDQGRLKCPCTKCNNMHYRNFNEAYDHMICIGFSKNYTRWVFHGEPSSLRRTDEHVSHHKSEPHDEDNVMFHEACGITGPTIEADGQVEEDVEQCNPDAATFYKLVKDAEKDLYPGCKFTKLSFIVRIYHIKCLGRWTNKSIAMLLEFLKELFPDIKSFPDNFAYMKKMITELGLSYHKIDACPNDCMLYWKNSSKKESCDVCGASRWKTYDRQSDDKEKKTPNKILRHFPLKPRLQRLFMCSKTASHMRWHDELRTKDGILRHPADSLAWKTLDLNNPSFASEPRNVRLGLASDGFNPFGTLSIAHSIWPVVVIPYNLPPWMCMKQPNMFLSLLISGPTSPGNDMDTYLQPLVEELKELWEVGLPTYDASKNETFHMRAALLWTISDFPGYAMLSGWSTKGRLACPSCHEDTCSHYLKRGRKQCYMGHRRFLPDHHKFRIDRQSFDGTVEVRSAPTPLSGTDVLNQLRGVNFILGKKSARNSAGKRRRSDDTSMMLNWKKKSIFFELPYWEHNLLRHNLDVMHIEKNVCDNVLGTLLSIEGKTKDNLNARLDLQEMGLRQSLHPIQSTKTSKISLPTACFTMDNNEKELFCSVLKKVKVPDGYSSNISRRVSVKEHKISGLKSHDCHVLMQQLLPLAVRRVLPKNVCSIVIDLCGFFRELCSKTLRDHDLRRLEAEVAVTLCQLERIFPPAFFDIMVHLPIHLAAEAMLGGPVQYRWMYPIERFLFTLKSYVRNRSAPEGSIAEGYLAEECLTFCSRYFNSVETRLNRPVRNNDDNGLCDLSSERRKGRAIGKEQPFQLGEIERIQAHRYVLFNCDVVTPYLDEHIQSIRNRMHRPRAIEIERMHNEKFHSWFDERVQLMRSSGIEVSEKIRWLAQGPQLIAKRMKGYIINGYRFHTRERERRAKTQNSGVVVTAKTTSFSSSRDMNPVAGDVTYYGQLTDIIELLYSNHLRFILFKCDWVDVRAHGRGIKVDEFGFTLVNFKRLMSSGQKETDEPFVLASQANQVFYVPDPSDDEWHVVVKTRPRDFFDMQGEDCVDDEPYYENEPFHCRRLDDNTNVQDSVTWVRENVPKLTIVAPPQLRQAKVEDHRNELHSNSDGEESDFTEPGVSSD